MAWGHSYGCIHLEAQLKEKTQDGFIHASGAWAEVAETALGCLDLCFSIGSLIIL